MTEMNFELSSALNSSIEDEEPFLPGSRAAPKGLSRRWRFFVCFRWVIIATLCVIIARDYIHLRRSIP